MKDSLDHMPAGERWEFDASTTEVFSDMLARSIPQYEVMRETVHEVGRRFVPPTAGAVLDLGCSRGDALAAFIESFGPRASYLGIDVSDPMLEAARERFRTQADLGIDVRVLKFDLREGFPAGRFDVILSVLTIQFTPIEHRLRILHDVRRALADSGCFLMVEKILGSSAEMDALLVEHYLDHKRRSGYSEESIQRKKLSLEGALVPVTARWNEDLLRAAGFRHVECIWRWMNFAAWVALP